MDCNWRQSSRVGWYCGDEIIVFQIFTVYLLVVKFKIFSDFHTVFTSNTSNKIFCVGFYVY